MPAALAAYIALSAAAISASKSWPSPGNRATPALAKPLKPKNEKDAGKLKLRMQHAGFRSEGAPSVFLGLKLVGLIMGVLMGGGSLLLISGVSQTSVFRAIMFAGGMFYLPDILLWFLARRRKEQIFLGLPDALDLMVVCVEAGLGRTGMAEAFTARKLVAAP